MTRSTTSPKWKSNLYKTLAVVFWLGVWQLLSSLIGQEILIVSPVRAVQTLLSFLTQWDFYRAVLFSFGRILSGFAMGLLSGLILSVIAHRFRAIRILIEPLMHAIKATPVASFVILALIFIRSRQLSVFISFLMVLPIAYTNLLTGLDSADKKLLEMAQVFRVSRMRQIRGIYLYAAYPHLLSACALSLGMCWKSGIAAEVIGLPDGSIGEALYQAKIFFNTPELFAWTLAIIIISLLFEKTVLGLLKRLQRRMEED